MRAAAGTGHVQAVTEPDGICRSVPVQEITADGPRWAFALEVFRVATGVRLNTAAHGVWAGGTFLWTLGRSGGMVSSIDERFDPALALVDFGKQLRPGLDTPPFPVFSAADLLYGVPIPDLQGKASWKGVTCDCSPAPCSSFCS
jgi:hypothetical protein